MKNVIVRAISGIVYVALIIGAIFGGQIWFMLLTAMFAILGVMELANLKADKKPEAISEEGSAEITEPGNPLSLWIGIVIDIFAVLTISIAPFAFTALGLSLSDLDVLIGLLVIGLPAFFISRIVVSLYDKTGNPLEHIARSALGVIYIGLPILALNALYAFSYKLVLLTFILIWLNDTGAFCFGITLGKHKMFPRLSPKKSWEGFFGGLLCCIVFGAACNVWLNYTGWGVAEWMIYGAVVCAFSTWGDLFESLIKRSCGAKDSGNLIPGHGGILDRIDSLLLVAPAVFIFYLIAQAL